MYSNKGRLVTFRTENDFEIIGMLFQDGNQIINPLVNYNRKLIIHIHGNYGNFYQNKFIWHMSNIYCNNGIDFLTINMSSHDGIAEGYYGKQLKYIGGGISDYEDSQLDIDAAIKFAKGLGYINIVLQGHSLGCDKVIQYSLDNDSVYKIILLSPVDGYAIQNAWRFPESVEEQIQRLESNKNIIKKDYQWGSAEFDWLPANEYGAKGSTEEWVYQIPITRTALLSILKGSTLKYLNLNKNPEYYIYVPTFVYIGAHDELLVHKQKDMDIYLSSKFADYTSVLDLNANHDIVGVEEVLARRIVRWVNGEIK